MTTPFNAFAIKLARSIGVEQNGPKYEAFRKDLLSALQLWSRSHREEVPYGKPQTRRVFAVLNSAKKLMLALNGLDEFCAADLEMDGFGSVDESADSYGSDTVRTERLKKSLEASAAAAERWLLRSKPRRRGRRASSFKVELARAVMPVFVRHQRRHRRVKYTMAKPDYDYLIAATKFIEPVFDALEIEKPLVSPPRVLESAKSKWSDFTRELDRILAEELRGH